MIVLFLLSLLVGKVASQGACQIRSFEWTAADKSTKTEFEAGDTAVLKCASSSDLCVGTLKISGPDLTTAIKTSGYKTEVEVKLKTEGKQQYVCEFLYNGQLYQKSVAFTVKSVPCKIQKLAYAQDGDVNYTLRCITTCDADIVLYLNNNKVNSASNADQLETTTVITNKGKYAIRCTMEVASKKEKDEFTITVIRSKDCQITEMFVKKLVLTCTVSCEGDVKLSGPNSWGRVGKFGPGGGTLTKEIPSDDDYTGKYSCKYTPGGTSSEEHTLTVNPVCSVAPALSVSASLPKVGEKITLACKSDCKSDTLVLARYDPPNHYTLKTSKNGNVQHAYETENTGDINFICFLLSDQNNLFSVKKVTVRSCLPGEKYYSCGTSCGIVYCTDDDDKQQSCLTSTAKSNCDGKCRCPEERPYWNGTSSQGSCVSKCPDSSKSTSSVTSSWWIWLIVAIAIVVLVAAVVCIIRICKKKQVKEQDQVLKPVKNTLEPGQVTRNKMVDEDSDPLYQDDIQYSERSDQYYMEPDEVRKPASLQRPPPLPSAPIPTIERETEVYNDPVLNPAIRTEQTLETPRTIIVGGQVDEGTYEGEAYNNIPGVVHTTNRASNADDVLQIKFTSPNIYENRE